MKTTKKYIFHNIAVNLGTCITSKKKKRDDNMPILLDQLFRHLVLNLEKCILNIKNTLHFKRVNNAQRADDVQHLQLSFSSGCDFMITKKHREMKRSAFSRLLTIVKNRKAGIYISYPHQNLTPYTL